MKNKFAITNDEYALLDKKYGRLCYDASWKLLRRNYNSGSFLEIEDVIQETKMALTKAAVYFKRQTYIEDSLEIAKAYCKDKFIFCIVCELERLWENRRHHGANKRTFGDHQENMLDLILNRYVPKELFPDVSAKLLVNRKFEIYIKSIIWNATKHIGKKVTKDSGIRIGLVSLSDKDFVI